MKVLHYIDSLARGGTENLLLDLFRIHSHHGHEFHLATARGGEMEEDFKRLGIPLFKLGGRRPGLDLHLIASLRSQIRAYGYNLVHTHTVLDSMDAWLATIGLGCPQVMSVHGYDFDDTPKLKLFSRVLFPRLDRVIFVSSAVQSYYRTKYKYKNQSVVHNGVNLAKFKENSRSSVRMELAIPDGIHLSGMVGNFVNQVRNQKFICRSLIRLSKIRKDFRFLFIGRRSDEIPQLFDECQALINDAGINDLVLFLGGRRDVPRLMRALDSYAYASHSDTFGISVVEAMIAGVPCIINDLPTLCEVVGGEEFGNIYASEDEQEFCNLMIQLLDGDRKFSAKAQKAQGFASTTYSIESCLSNYVSVYAEVLKNSKHE